jgi:transcriptional regulator with XRE-family HTH domain
MTPFGAKIRQLRQERNVSLKQMAEAVGVSSAYLSALEHGHRGRPSWYLVQRIIAFFNVIWDDAEAVERLARLSHPRVTVDTAGMTPAATEAANLMAERIGSLSADQIDTILDILKTRQSTDA